MYPLPKGNEYHAAQIDIHCRNRLGIILAAEDVAADVPECNRSTLSEVCASYGSFVCSSVRQQLGGSYEEASSGVGYVARNVAAEDDGCAGTYEQWDGAIRGVVAGGGGARAMFVRSEQRRVYSVS